MTYAAEISGLSKTLAGRQVIQHIDLSLPQGSCVALIGHNGAGKTTLFKLMLGLSRPTSGVIKIFGDDPARARALGRIGFLPENVNFSPALTGRELLAYYARLKGERPSACLGLLKRVGLEEAGFRFLQTYSKGMRQRLGLAQALIGAPRLLLLDEPTTGLDVAARRALFEIITQLRNEGAAVLLSAHSLTDLDERADRIVIMSMGTVIATGSIEELREAARLPIKISVLMPEGERLPTARLQQVEGLRSDGRLTELVCCGRDKIPVLRALFESHASIEDIRIASPSLEQIYDHFNQNRGDGE